MSTTTDDLAALRAENAALRERLDALERERSAEVARLQAALAAAQERSYWLDRWHLDLNALMATPWGVRFRAVMRAVRAPVRLARLVSRQLRGQ